jgi:GNAT superfamily N-acetyltransferase
MERSWEQTKDKRERARSIAGTVKEARLIHGDRHTAKDLRITRYGSSRPAEDAIVRPATAEDAPVLSDLALRSKAYWLYDDQFLEACREELTVHPEDIERYRVTVLDYAGHQLGFFGLEGDPPHVELWWFFLDPIMIGSGGGRILWEHMIAVARSLGMKTLRIESDPNAEDFYLHMGARRVGEVRSLSIRGRLLPLLTYDIK